MVRGPLGHLTMTLSLSLLLLRNHHLRMRRTRFHFLRHTVIFVQTRRQTHCAHEDESKEEWGADCGGTRFHGARENTFSICQTQEKSVCYTPKPKKVEKIAF